LIVFPAPVKNTAEYGVYMEKINGKCRRGGTNTIEAQRVAEEAVEFMRCESQKDETRMCSLGVVAMNQAQKELIYDEIQRLLTRYPKAYAYTQALENRKGGLENFFVKNLENVQGDERDVIYISATYGPDPDSGVVYQRFGPINTDLGYRRLNVLFTRAKQQLRLFTSMKPDDVKISDPNTKRGRRVLHDYLEYAATGRLYGGENNSSEPTNNFELFVKNRLEARGFDVDCQVGVAGYFLDLAVSHPSFPNGYIAGVECDGATYHTAFSARDRDRLREEVLRNLGWDIYRVWSTDWFANPDVSIQHLAAPARC
jgi:very-short-patch-repair endonuclease